MPKFFETMDRVRPVYDWVYKVVMVVCKLLLIADILLTSYAVAGRLIGGIQLPDGRYLRRYHHHRHNKCEERPLQLPVVHNDRIGCKGGEIDRKDRCSRRYDK